jgi:hypothetical protein
METIVAVPSILRITGITLWYLRHIPSRTRRLHAIVHESYLFQRRGELSQSRHSCKERDCLSPTLVVSTHGSIAQGDTCPLTPDSMNLRAGSRTAALRHILNFRILNQLFPQPPAQRSYLNSSCLNGNSILFLMDFLLQKSTKLLCKSEPMIQSEWISSSHAQRYSLLISGVVKAESL